MRPTAEHFQLIFITSWKSGENVKWSTMMTFLKWCI